MSRQEEEPKRHSSEPLVPLALPPDLAAFLVTQDVACLMHETTNGTAHVIKLPLAEIESVRGRVPIQVRHELYVHPSAPVIRSVITIYDQPDRPLALETMTNIAEKDQRDDFGRLATQKELLLLFYDEQLRHRLSKRVGNADPEIIELHDGAVTELTGRAYILVPDITVTVGIYPHESAGGAIGEVTDS